MTARHVLGLDLSITATGLVHRGYRPSLGVRAACAHTIKPPASMGDRRLGVIEVDLMRFIYEDDNSSVPEFALIEDLPVHGKAAGITGMVHGVVRRKLHDLGVPYGLVVPSTLKKYATGKGAHPGQGKTPMAVAALKRAGAEFDDDNQCDAWWLWVMAHDYLGAPLFPLPQVNRESLTKIKKG